MSVMSSGTNLIIPAAASISNIGEAQ